jgi:hypothetical protein
LDFKQLEQAAQLFVLFVRKGAEDKIGILTDLLKPAEVESIFGSFRPVNLKIHSSDLEIMKCLLSDAHMPVEDIAKDPIQNGYQDWQQQYYYSRLGGTNNQPKSPFYLSHTHFLLFLTHRENK